MSTINHNHWSYQFNYSNSPGNFPRLDFFVKLGQALIPNRKDSGGIVGFNEGLSPVAYLGSYFYGMLQKGHTSDGRQGGESRRNSTKNPGSSGLRCGFWNDPWFFRWNWSRHVKNSNDHRLMRGRPIAQHFWCDHPGENRVLTEITPHFPSKKQQKITIFVQKNKEPQMQWFDVSFSHGQTCHIPHLSRGGHANVANWAKRRLGKGGSLGQDEQNRSEQMGEVNIGYISIYISRIYLYLCLLWL